MEYRVVMRNNLPGFETEDIPQTEWMYGGVGQSRCIQFIMNAFDKIGADPYISCGGEDKPVHYCQSGSCGTTYILEHRLSECDKEETV